MLLVAAACSDAGGRSEVNPLVDVSFDADVARISVIDDGLALVELLSHESNSQRIAAVDLQRGLVLWEHVAGHDFHPSTIGLADGMALHYRPTGGAWEVIARDAETGAELWRRDAATASLVDGRVVMLAPAGVSVVDLATGSTRWEAPNQSAREILDDKVLLSSRNKDPAFLEMRDLATGETLWGRWAPVRPALGATLSTKAAPETLIVATDTGALGVDAATGDRLWTTYLDPAPIFPNGLVQVDGGFAVACVTTPEGPETWILDLADGTTRFSLTPDPGAVVIAATEEVLVVSEGASEETCVTGRGIGPHPGPLTAYDTNDGTQRWTASDHDSIQFVTYRRSGQPSGPADVLASLHVERGGSVITRFYDFDQGQVIAESEPGSDLLLTERHHVELRHGPGSNTLWIDGRSAGDVAEEVLIKAMDDENLLAVTIDARLLVFASGSAVT
ncbi:MAG: PQQ-binding-like beta-propeller repeat protein [Actinomycetota bacterium]